MFRGTLPYFYLRGNFLLSFILTPADKREISCKQLHKFYRSSDAKVWSEFAVSCQWGTISKSELILSLPYLSLSLSIKFICKFELLHGSYSAQFYLGVLAAYTYGMQEYTPFSLKSGHCSLISKYQLLIFVFSKWIVWSHQNFTEVIERNKNNVKQMKPIFKII